MYGYIVPNTETISPRDFGMLKAAYCGLCVAIKEDYGQLPRFSVSYDMAFFTLVAIEVGAPVIEFENVRCIGQPQLKTVIKPGPFTAKAAAVSMILFWYKLVDDGVDGGKKSVLRKLMRRHYEKARLLAPEADRIVSDGYDKLREVEKERSASLDRAADSFAGIMAGLIQPFIHPGSGEKYRELAAGLCYNLGKFVYLCDAIDDVDEDASSCNYNPVLSAYPDYEKGKRKEYLERHARELSFALNSAVYRITECFNGIRCTEVEGVLKNVIYEGLSGKVEELLSSEKKLSAPRVAIPRHRRAAYREEWKAFKSSKPASENKTGETGDGE